MRFLLLVAGVAAFSTENSSTRAEDAAPNVNANVNVGVHLVNAPPPQLPNVTTDNVPAMAFINLGRRTESGKSIFGNITRQFFQKVAQAGINRIFLSNKECHVMSSLQKYPGETYNFQTIDSSKNCGGRPYGPAPFTNPYNYTSYLKHVISLAHSHVPPVKVCLSFGGVGSQVL